MASATPAASPADRAQVTMQVEDYPALERALGAPAFRQLLVDFHRKARPGGLAALPDHLAQHRYGTTPALVDLARLERALIVSARSRSVDAVGPCCLPPEILRTHPGLTIAFHPMWQWLELATPADHWRQALLGTDGKLNPPSPSITRLRISPEAGRTVARLSPAAFQFEHALLAGQSLREATLRAQAQSISFDPNRAMHALLMAGAVIDFALHPATQSSDR